MAYNSGVELERSEMVAEGGGGSAALPLRNLSPNQYTIFVQCFSLGLLGVNCLFLIISYCNRLFRIV